MDPSLQIVQLHSAELTPFDVITIYQSANAREADGSLDGARCVGKREKVDKNGLFMGGERSLYKRILRKTRGWNFAEGRGCTPERVTSCARI